ncbi:hypothetical protein B296_00033317 [Ensete ventricosum]|uniref:Uncharacterized protein n=1 Tax=Ensete ventricosum TaxID=4639 RepID=A0A427ABB5_ENSVE|nr:hypothetical protein B296_00033317 [Ensete ventricosum]
MRRHLVSWETRRRLPSPRGRQGVASLRLMGDVAVHRLPTQEAEASPRLPARGRGRVTASSFCTGMRQHLVFQLGDEAPPRFSRETKTLRLAYPRPSLLPPTFPSSQQLFQEEEEEAKQSDSIPSRLLLCEPHCD